MNPLEILDVHWISRLRQLGVNRLLLAYSGGLDSLCLLHMAVAFVARHPEFSLQALHVHHGLNPAADDWVAHCQLTCDRLGVPLRVERVGVHREARQSLEAVAREVRYQALAAQMSPTTALLTAHHQDDQLETLLLALKRGAGPRGLGGMPPEQTFGSGWLIRPLLATSRPQLVALAESAGWQWIEDDSNQDQRFDRNFLRHSIVPVLSQRWPAIATTAARSATLCREQEQLLLEVAEADLAGAITPQGGLLLRCLHPLSMPRRHNLLRHWLRKCCGQVPEAEALQRIWSEVVLARADASPALQWHGGVIRRYADSLWLTPSLGPIPPTCWISTWPAQWQGAAGSLRLLPVERAAQLRMPTTAEAVSLRFAVAGSQRLHPLERAHSRELKKLWHEYQIAPWLREQWPVLFYGEQIAAIPGVLVCRGFEASLEAPGLAWQWQGGPARPACA